ncbi:chemotaxis protein CheZ [Desulfobaculum xiamenense]|uniref:Chemotaxis protein CheZ n=1 Tax=Desulfobaculum xiamenense TaxID=995050 RepID=A0A846QN78_9BACT|nr:protein phosphatase CheZ [Desulfobaculum xiamenense]NJB66865.1 chemotaxis protein CheZ [Desulfobaculum xiamenense]
MTPKIDKQLDQLVEQVTQSVVAGLDAVIKDAIVKEVTNVLTKSLNKEIKDGEFFRKVNDDMRHGLEEIYKEIKKAKQNDSAASLSSGSRSETDQLITEASDQLDEILKSTEDATVRIMDIVEKHQEMIAQSGKLLREFRSGGASKDSVNRLIELNDTHTSDLIDVMTALSFQDLTGQRIKRIVSALKRIEEVVFSLYVSTGLAVKKRDEEPERDTEEIAKEARQTASELKGPQGGTSQGDVDDLLKQLGLE